MQVKKEPMRFQLKHSVTYNRDGAANTEATFLELYEYSGKNRKEYLKLKSMVTKAMMSMSIYAQKMRELKNGLDKDIGEEEGDPSTSFLSMAIDLANNVDGEEFVDTFGNMILCKANPLCKIDGVVTMQDGIWQDMHADDQFDLAVAYCSFFGIGLAFLKKNG